MKQLKQILIILLILPICMLFGCVTTNKEYDNIKVIESSVGTKYGINQFDISSLVLEIRKGEEVVKTVNVNNNNISSDDLTKFGIIGKHTITINYENLKTTFLLNVVETYNVFFYDGNKLLEKRAVLAGDDLLDIPHAPSKLNYSSKWDRVDFTNIQSDIDVHTIYISEPNLKIEEVVKRVDDELNDFVVDDNFYIDKYIGNCTISWSTNTTYLKEDGTYDRPYHEDRGTITVIVDDGVNKVTKDYNVVFKGYKALNEGIASGYVFSGYPNLDETFFDTMDIVYCAFVMVDVDGNFIGKDTSGGSILQSNKSTLAKINTYVKPNAKRVGTYVVASLGGGGDVMADTFDVIAADPVLRKNLAKNVVDMINEYDLDGVDVDWETPSYSKRHNFTLMMEEIYKAVKANNPNHLVTSAIGGGGWQPQLYELEKSIEYLDYVNVMSYSMYSSGGYYQSPLYSVSSYYNSTYKVGRSSESVDSSIDTYNSIGVTNDKLIIGAAFYGKRQTKSGSSWRSQGSVNYDVIKQYRTNGDYYSFYDERAEAPFLLKKDGKIFISFDDERSIIAKCNYVLEQKLAGIMYWENGCDPTGDLVKAIKEGLGK